MSDRDEMTPSSPYSDTMLGQAYRRQALAEQGLSLAQQRQGATQPRPMETGSLVSSPHTSGRRDLRAEVEAAQRQPDESLAILLREHRVVDCAPPPEAANYWAAVERLWSERAAQEWVRIHKEHAAALARLEDQYFLKHALSSEEYRTRYTQLHERTRQQLEAAEALRAQGAFDQFMVAACAAAEGALGEFWARQLDDWRREFPLPEGEPS